MPPELIIGVVALNSGLYDVVKASVAGSIIGNILLVLGAAMLAGGIKFNVQAYNPMAARSQATMLTLTAIALMGLAVFRAMLGPLVEMLTSISAWRSPAFCLPSTPSTFVSS